MISNKDDHNFNWVEARHACSVGREFSELKSDLKEIVETRDGFMMRRSSVSFGYRGKDQTEGSHCCSVIRSENSVIRDRVRFCLDEENDRIEVKGTEKSIILTLTLNDEGECRYQIDGKGEYLRWQVLRRILEPLFFGKGGFR